MNEGTFDRIYMASKTRTRIVKTEFDEINRFASKYFTICTNLTKKIKKQYRKKNMNTLFKLLHDFLYNGGELSSIKDEINFIKNIFMAEYNKTPISDIQIQISSSEDESFEYVDEFESFTVPEKSYDSSDEKYQNEKDTVEKAKREKFVRDNIPILVKNKDKYDRMRKKITKIIRGKKFDDVIDLAKEFEELETLFNGPPEFTLIKFSEVSIFFNVSNCVLKSVNHGRCYYCPKIYGFDPYNYQFLKNEMAKFTEYIFKNKIKFFETHKPTEEQHKNIVKDLIAFLQSNLTKLSYDDFYVELDENRSPSKLVSEVDLETINYVHRVLELVENNDLSLFIKEYAFNTKKKIADIVLSDLIKSTEFYSKEKEYFSEAFMKELKNCFWRLSACMECIRATEASKSFLMLHDNLYLDKCKRTNIRKLNDFLLYLSGKQFYHLGTFVCTENCEICNELNTISFNNYSSKSL
ncbi:hypothetical protein MHBO_000009 [Bonamia ostreae]|uniref:Uncharacterized protein n=1 Tax=Bonamia ostreae TaxID=126728 RepID=A0ABV2AE53_9EUKA